MKKSGSLVLFLIAISSSAFSIGMTLSPASMNRTGQGFVNLSISNLTAGADVNLSVYLDINTNGIIDSSEPLVAQFELKDGKTNSMGAVTLVDDRDGIANGQIETAVSFYGKTYLHSIGDYIWQVVEFDGSGTPTGTDTSPFSITQPSSATWITGEIQNYVTSDTIAGAYVELLYFSDSTGSAPSTWADENGVFSIQLPTGVPSNEVLGISTAAKGYMSANEDPEGNSISLAVFTNGLTAGENALVRPLFVIPPIPAYDLVDITGTVYLIEDSETNALSGALVEIEYPTFGDDDDGDEVSSFDISNTNGQFALVFPTADDQWDSVILSCKSSLLNLQGIVPSATTLFIEGATNGIAIYCHPAEALLRGTVTDRDTTDPIIGMEVNLTSGSDSVGSAYTISNGTYEIGAMAGSYGLQCDEDSLANRHYVYNNENGYLYIDTLGQGEVRSGQDLAYSQGHLISGHVYSKAGIPIGGGSTLLVRPDDSGGTWEERMASSIVAFDGHYDLLAPAGTWNVRTENHDSYWIDLYHTNCLPANRATATPIVISNTPVGGIDFYLTEGARLQGNISMPDLAPAGNIQMSAFQLNGSGELEFVGSGLTDWEAGAFDFVVPAGSSIYLRADSDRWQTPDTWLGNVGSHNLATLIHPVVGNTQSGLDIQILAGYMVSVWLKDQTSMSALSNITVRALDSSSNLYAIAHDDEALVVPANTPLTFFATAEGYEGEYMTNTYHLADAGYYQLPAGNYLSLEFVLHATSTDTDKDGLPDYLEDSHPDGIMEPNDQSSPQMPDSDSDGAGDYQEYYAGTDAWDPNSIFKLTEATPVGAGLLLRWNSVPGREYTVQLSSDLIGGSWSNIHTVVATGAESTYEPATTNAHDYYRVQVTP